MPLLLERRENGCLYPCKTCLKCRQQNVHPQCHAQLHFGVPLMPMHFTALDLIGRFKMSPQGHLYVLTIIDMLTNYKWLLLLFTKEAD